jgi:ectoine hydroxylase-related dioxygenase (phytanoyl-CoA dioxygenase family)
MPEPTTRLAVQVAARGFAIAPGVFDVSEIESLLDALDRHPLRRSRAGARHAMSNPVVAEFVQDARLLAMDRSVLGPDAVPYRATLFDKSPESNWLVVWHQDTALPLRARSDVPGWGPWSVKAGVNYAHAPTEALSRVLALRIHFDESAESNGPLRVLPETHRLGVLTDEAVHEVAALNEPVDCLVPRGGVLAMRPLIIHASSKSRSDAPRRVLHVEFAATLSMGPGLDLAIA